MKITVKGYITCKDAENYSDCADNYACNAETNRFAISDGVTKSFFPQIWSKILVENFVALKGATEFSIEDCQSEWLKQVTEKITCPNVKWFTRNAFSRQESGLATFVSLYFDKEKWVAHTLGDSFLFFIPKGRDECFDDWVKLSSKSEPVIFDNFPDYYSSREKAHGEVKLHEGTLEEGTFYLMTDALAEWVFNEKENALNEVREKWNTQSDFQTSVNELRELQKLNNDDSSVLIIDIKDDGKPEFSYVPVTVTEIKDLIKKETENASLADETLDGSKVIEASVQPSENLENEVTNEKCSESEFENMEKETDNHQNNTSETIVELSQNAKDVLDYCSKMHENTLAKMEDIIKNGVSKKIVYINVPRCVAKKKPISVDEQKMVKEKLEKEYGISFKN